MSNLCGFILISSLFVAGVLSGGPCSEINSLIASLSSSIRAQYQEVVRINSSRAKVDQLIAIDFLTTSLLNDDLLDMHDMAIVSRLNDLGPNGSICVDSFFS
ncbi:hypothetical protein ACKWTF_010464 [Chironomus riparius]